jgi:hypothetical protein
MQGPLIKVKIRVEMEAIAWVREDGRGDYDLEDIAEIQNYENLEVISKL